MGRHRLNRAPRSCHGYESRPTAILFFSLYLYLSLALRRLCGDCVILGVVEVCRSRDATLSIRSTTFKVTGAKPTCVYIYIYTCTVYLFDNEDTLVRRLQLRWRFEHPLFVFFRLLRCQHGKDRDN